MENNYIVVEGSDFAGKSELIVKLKEHYESKGRHVTVVREPGGDPVAEELRQILKYSKHPICNKAETYLFMAARAQVLEHVVLPALKRGDLVIADRAYYSTVCYQIGDYTSSEADLVCEQTYNVLGIAPINLILNIDYETLLARQASRGIEVGERIEARGEEFFRKAIRLYQEISQTFPDAHSIDATGSRESTLDQCITLLDAIGV